MTSREIIICLAIKHKGNWDDIFEAIKNHEIIPDEEQKFLLESINSDVVTLLDDEYPNFLKSTWKPPFALFYHGNIKLLKEKEKSISVVGSRECSKYGEMMTKKIVSELSKNFIIVSGMARGIDGIAHTCALDNNGSTIAVLGSGINYCYPLSNKELYERMIRNQLVISEYPDKTPPTEDAFPIRNRIIAALSRCLVITEGKKRSGTSITAALMIENGGDVCCVPTKAGEDSLCNNLISNGAYLIETAQDVYDVIKFKPKTPII